MKKENVFLVGGAVRDTLLGINPKDKDYVVIGYNEKEMLNFGFEPVAKDFPIFLHPETGDEYALARKECKSGSGYNGFIVETKDITLEEDLFRRDLTINAMAMDYTGKIIDPYGGQNDLKNKTLKHVSVHFAEDPVRILRIARFSARYNFLISDQTVDMMQKMVKNGEFNSLTSERVWKEFDKVLSEKYLINFFINLEKINALNKIPGFSSLKELEFFDFIENNANNKYIANLFHTFSQMEKIDLLKWKIPSEEKNKINQFKFWKENSNFYSNMNIKEKLNFIQSNRSLQNQIRSKELIENINLYKNWKNNLNLDLKTELNSFECDIINLKSLDYHCIVEKAKEIQEKPTTLIKEYQIKALTSTKKMKP